MEKRDIDANWKNVSNGGFILFFCFKKLSDYLGHSFMQKLEKKEKNISYLNLSI